jgi:hypothetical protein
MLYDLYTSFLKKKDESIAPLFIGGFNDLYSIHQIKWL